MSVEDSRVKLASSSEGRADFAIYQQYATPTKRKRLVYEVNNVEVDREVYIDCLATQRHFFEQSQLFFLEQVAEHLRNSRG
jgi:hypothetical protein